MANLSTYRTMDPHLLVGLVNTALRNEHANLEDFVRTHDLDRDALETRLGEAGYHWREDVGQFRAGAPEGR